jgi:hypothetical protein
MNQNANVHWGQWMLRRANYVGFKRRSDIASAIGCNCETFRIWGTMATVPDRFTRGYDAALARELQTTKRMLFIDFKTTSPEDAPIIETATAASA